MPANKNQPWLSFGYAGYLRCISLEGGHRRQMRRMPLLAAEPDAMLLFGA
jgi:hypothetical protein